VVLLGAALSGCAGELAGGPAPQPAESAAHLAPTSPGSLAEGASRADDLATVTASLGWPPAVPRQPAGADPYQNRRGTPAPAGMAGQELPPGESLLPPLKVALVWTSEETPAPLAYPVALAVGRGDEVYVVEAGNDRIQVFDRDGRFVRRWGGRGGDAGQFRFRRGDQCSDDDLSHCRPDVGGGVAVAATGEVYVADYGNHRVQRFDGGGRLLGGWGREGGGPGEFRLPHGIAVDGTGRVYVSDGDNGRVQVFDRDGRYLAHWATLDPVSPYPFRPAALAIDGHGRVWVGDRWGGYAQAYDRSGRRVADWQARAAAPPGGLAQPAGLAVDRHGLLHAGAFDRIESVDRFGRHLVSWRGDWLGEAVLERPAALAAAGDGGIYVADEARHRVYKFFLLLPAVA
jgi:DNA-binding beta-propeller fold protein YncE